MVAGGGGDHPHVEEKPKSAFNSSAAFLKDARDETGNALNAPIPTSEHRALNQFAAAVLKDAGDKTVISLLFANQTEEDILVREMLEGLQVCAH